MCHLSSWYAVQQCVGVCGMCCCWHDACTMWCRWIWADMIHALCGAGGCDRQDRFCVVITSCKRWSLRDADESRWCQWHSCRFPARTAAVGSTSELQRRRHPAAVCWSFCCQPGLFAFYVFRPSIGIARIKNCGWPKIDKWSEWPIKHF